MSAAIVNVLDNVDAQLARADVPRLSPFWRAEAERFYTDSRMLVACVGRGGAKTQFSIKTALAETIGGDFKVPAGEQHFFTFVSENVSEASKTLSILEAYLRILKIPFARRGDTIDLANTPRGFKVLAARVGAVSGWRSFGWAADECAKWGDDGRDPTSEVIASLRATTVTHASARGRMLSSPLAASGFFHDVWALGDHALQVTAHAPSWVANPSISEQRTRELEPHEPTWRREYAAVPSAGVSVAMSAEDVHAMVRPLPPAATQLGPASLFIDSSSGRGDGWSFCAVAAFNDGGVRRLRVARLGAFEGKFANVLPFRDVVEHCARVGRTIEARRCFGDQHEAYSLESEFGRHGIAYAKRDWTAPAKVEATSALRRMLRERTIVVDPGEEASTLARELLMLEEKLLPSGVISIQARRTGSGHADRASLLLLIARVESEGELRFGSADGAPPQAPRVVASSFGVGVADFTTPDDAQSRRGNWSRTPPKAPTNGPRVFGGARRGGWGF